MLLGFFDVKATAFAAFGWAQAHGWSHIYALPEESKAMLTILLPVVAALIYTHWKESKHD